ncbi:hypothetical protein BSNK01_31500 [Bacillaceae bacterium]
MDRQQKLSLFLAVLTVLFLIGIGISIGENSVIGALVAAAGAALTVKLGFSLRKKQRETEREEKR